MKNQIIAIGGIGRSGTSILGSLIGSFQDVEYFYEPITVNYLFAEIDNFPKEIWVKLFNHHIYFELLINSLAGRNINTNKNDLSSVYKIKSEKEIKKRLKQKNQNKVLEPLARNKTIAFKILNNIVQARKIINLIPNLKQVVVIRDPNSVMCSMEAKHWFSDINLSPKSHKSPNKQTLYKNIYVPSYISKSDYDYWVEANELERYIFTYIQFMKILVEHKDIYLVIDYNRFIDEPKKYLELLLDYFSQKPGAKTKEILDIICYQDKKRFDLIGKVDKSLSDRAIQLYNMLK